MSDNATPMEVDAPANNTEDSKPVDAAPELEDITSDKCGGVMKQLIKEGEGWERPKKGSEVYVHYVGTLLDGTKFDSSRDRSTPFQFQIDSGSVIRGWDIAVKSMKKGEVAKFTLMPEYAYGASGSPPKIPANATLVFEIELLSFRNEKDLTNDGGVLKKILQEGKEKYGPSPSYESKAKVHLVARLAHTNTEVINETREITIGDEEVPRGVEKAIESLKEGEKAHFLIRADYAYGAAGLSERGIPAGADLEYEIELLGLQKEKDSWQLHGFAEKLDAANKRKTQGNELYSKGKFARAIAKYKHGVDFIEYMNSATEDEKKQGNAIKLSSHLNIAQCCLKLHDWKKAIEHCDKALELEKNNAKALYRRAQAHTALDHWDLARADFEHVLKLTPGEADVIREYNRLKQRIKAQDERDKKIYGSVFKNMFAASSEEPSSKKAEPDQQNEQPATAAAN